LELSHQAWAQTQGQLAWYKAMEELEKWFKSEICELDVHLNPLEKW